MKTQLVGSLLLLALASATAMAQHNYSPPQGCVPDSVTALGVAGAIIRGVVGEEVAGAPTELRATLSDGVWQIRSAGGRVALVELAQSDARVIRIRMFVEGGQSSDVEPQNGFVADAVVAAAVGEMILGAVYGRDRIRAQLPLLAVESEGVWTIRGQRARGTLGGVALIEVRRRDGAVVRVTHSR